ncbi:Lysophospholipase, alpha-beta hydrolase superfamily [Mesobacillus persicus]|uniref:Lysophospholipase, alpha-beta hydrolase superfamily n=1 Tax=Mesobacillus persicus TaxID=930146 RepID=A0A1H8I255_9BACI|nr:alpha/beta hydrolase [Mesobacillus persicus]SEN62422.1 Lysophospholipase, alpha-beta hydrolase superfamily [Mesobacillus persicus]
MDKMKRIRVGKIRATTNRYRKEEIKKYIELYQLDLKDVKHRYEMLNCMGESIFLQSFTPKDPIGNVVVIHGYLDHAGSMSNLINDLTRNRYKVITYDLQGHGLSSGKRAEINRFNDYVAVFNEVYTKLRRRTSLPVHIVAHSTGGAIVMDYMLRFHTDFQKVIFVAPLVRSHAWNLSRLGFFLIKPFLKEPKRLFKRNSSNHDYLKFVKTDPLQHHKVPLAWYEALIAWNKELKIYPTSNKKVTVIQGDKDRTVDWKYNLGFIQRKFPNARVQIIHGGDHQLLNEHQPILQETLKCIYKELNGD